jgi:hypothetical protein
MKNKESFFMQLDQWLFQQVDRLQQSMPMQKWNELVSNLEENQQKAFNQIVSLLITFVPITLALLITMTNCSMKREIENKKLIVKEIDRLNSSKEQFEQVARPILAAVTLVDKTLFDQRIKIHLERDSIPLENVTVNDFNSFPLGPELLQSQASLIFKSLTLTDFSNLITSLIQREKMILVDIEVSKDEKNELLKGTFSLNSFGKTKN